MRKRLLVCLLACLLAISSTISVSAETMSNDEYNSEIQDGEMLQDAEQEDVLINSQDTVDVLSEPAEDDGLDEASDTENDGNYPSEAEKLAEDSSDVTTDGETASDTEAGVDADDLQNMEDMADTEEETPSETDTSSDENVAVEETTMPKLNEDELKQEESLPSEASQEPNSEDSETPEVSEKTEKDIPEEEIPLEIAFDEAVDNLEEMQSVKSALASTGITLNKKSAEIATGKSLQLTATVSSGAKVTWKSSNTAVATVNSSGKVTAKTYGKATITASLASGASATCKIQTRFNDVNNSGKAYYKPVYWAVDNGITKSTVTFKPNNTVTRGEFVAFLYRMAGEPSSSAKLSFKDVNSKTQFYSAIRWAVGKGIIKGYSDKTFRPTVGVTRGEASTMLWRYAGKPTPKAKVSPFSDVKQSTADSYKAILWGSENGIIKGTNGKFLKNNGCTRGNVVTFLYRYAGNDTAQPSTGYDRLKNIVKNKGSYSDSKYKWKTTDLSGRLVEFDYDPAKDEIDFYFIVISTTSSSTRAVSSLLMTIKGSDPEANPLVVCSSTIGSLDASGGGYIPLGSYNRDNGISWTLLSYSSSISASTWKGLFNSALALAITAWENDLLNYAGMSLADLGFSNF